MAADDERELKRLVEGTLAGNFDLRALRVFPLPGQYLEGIRPFLELGRGDCSSDSGYPKLREFYRTFATIEEGLTTLAREPAWRKAFDSFLDGYGYSACPADWGCPPMLVGVDLFSSKVASGLKGFSYSSTKEPNYPWKRHPPHTGAPPWPITQHQAITDFIKNFYAGGLC